MKALFRSRLRLIGAGLLFVVLLSACGAPLAGESWANLSTDGKYIYVAYKENIFKVDPLAGGESTSRQMIWLGQSPDKGHMYAAPAIADDGTLYVGTWDKRLLAFNTSSPNPIWKAPLGDGRFTDKVVGEALVNGDLVYVGMGDKGLKAFNRKTGAEVWKYDSTQYGVWSAPVIANGVLYFGSLDHFLYALDPATGTFKGKIDLGGAIGATPLVVDTTLYVGTFENKFLAVSIFNPTEMKIVNTLVTEGWVWATPVLQDGVLYFGDLSGYLYALDANSWSLKWPKLTDAEHPGAIRGKVAITSIPNPNGEKPETIVIVGTEGKFLNAYDADDGHRVWAASTGTEDKILSDLIVIGDYVIFTTLSENQILRAYNIKNGYGAWSVKLADEVARMQTATTAPGASQPPSTQPPATTAAPTTAQ